MNVDVAWLAALLARRYGASGATPRPLSADEGKRVYRIDRADGSSWLLRVGAPGADPARYHHDAAVLAWLERRGYPAPRLVRATDGSAVVIRERRPAWISTFVEGRPADFSPASLTRLGEALGRLHALAPDLTRAEIGDGLKLGLAGMLPRREIAAALAWLAEVSDAAPAELRARYDLIDAACRAVNPCADLPVTLIHNDCHPWNSIRTEDGRVVLIDWEGAGLGPAVIDVGFLLVSCEIDAFGPNQLLPDPARVEAVVDGYCRHRRLTAAELDRLADAIRFRSVVAMAGGFRRTIKEGLTEDPSAWAWARYHAADEIADRARRRFERQA